MLFALSKKFQVKYSCIPNHLYRTEQTNDFTKASDDKLEFGEDPEN